MKEKLNINSLMPCFLLAALVVIFGVATGGKILNFSNISAIINQSVMIIIGGLGMIFVTSMGGTDISVGSLAALAGTLAGMAAKSLGFWAVFPVAILVGLASGLFLGFVNSYLKVPSFMTSLAMLLAIRAGVNWILDASTVMSTRAVRMLDTMGIKLAILLGLILLVGYVFKYTRFGYYCRGIGENENAMAFIGINVRRIKLAAFLLSGMLAAVAGVFAIARNGGANNTMCMSFEMKVMMAMFIGSVPVNGGTESKLYKMIIGTFTIQILESGLILVGASGAVTQLIRGLVLIGAVYLSQTLRERLANGTKKVRQEASV